MSPDAAHDAVHFAEAVVGLQCVLWSTHTVWHHVKSVLSYQEYNNNMSHVIPFIVAVA